MGYETKIPCTRSAQMAKHLTLPVLQCPWSHIAVVFTTDLASSQGKMASLLVMNCPSGPFPPPALPAAFRTAELLFQHMFRYFGILEDIVAD